MNSSIEQKVYILLCYCYVINLTFCFVVLTFTIRTNRICTYRERLSSIYVCIHVCMHECMHACVYACMYVCMHVCMHACVYVCLYVFMTVCMYICIHILKPRNCIKNFAKLHTSINVAGM